MRSARYMRPMRTLLLVVVLGAAAPAIAQPLDGGLADARRGGGRHPTDLQPSILDMLTFVDPEWAPVVNGPTIDSDPVLLSGTAERMHGDSGRDVRSMHGLADVVIDVLVDPERQGKTATGNDEPHETAFEWEAGAHPDRAWPGFGDRTYGLGRQVFDCGHQRGEPGHGAEEAQAAGATGVTYPGPDFGAGAGGSQTFTTPGVGGEGGTCSVTTSTLCVVDADCAVSETCVTTGGVSQLRYAIERIS